ncbi:gliding motility protein [Rudanella paleaurantiibacter]|uniref:Gliding motility protein n=1 Tax=Rudanella paleaurantiibacter TaxID=2614655 RepID=A0A7J5U1E4_9BACT|nr:gliding motility protein [Rudanella paleaurantiibacter]KAB7731629.1 gliding motility protein [Rudanella paleaurantiibacter]
MRFPAALGALLAVLLLNSCAKKEQVPLDRLDQVLFAAKEPGQIREFLTRNKSIAQLYFGADNGPDSSLVADLHHRVNDPELNLLYKQVQDEFPEENELAAQLGEAFANIKKAYPDFKPPRVVTMVTGFMGPDLVVSDSLVIVGLDYFLGPKAKYRPRGPEFPQYILRRYAKEYIAPTVVFTLSDAFNKNNPADQTMLADMVYFGKGYVFTKTMMPAVADSLVIGYSDVQLTETYNAQDMVWAHFIDKQLIYETRPDIKNRYMNDRPFTAEIGPRCPGAIGRWVGWRIVGRYFDKQTNPSITDLMATDDARKLFQESGYKGQKDEN